MDILITGGAGSGTTFMAQLMQNMGRDLGDDCTQTNHRNVVTQVRGLEHKPLMMLLLSWTIRFFPVLKQANTRYNRNIGNVLALDDYAVARAVAPKVQQISAGLPQVVKNPNMMRWLGLWLLAGGKRPDHVFVMMRDTLDQALSNLRDGFTAQQDPLVDRVDIMTDYGFLLETLMRYHIGFDVINFPECATNPEVMAATLGIKQEQRLEYLRIFGETANPAGIKTDPMVQQKYRDLVRFEELASKPIPIGSKANVKVDGDESTYSVSRLEML